MSGSIQLIKMVKPNGKLDWRCKKTEKTVKSGANTTRVPTESVSMINLVPGYCAESSALAGGNGQNHFSAVALASFSPLRARLGAVLLAMWRQPRLSTRTIRSLSSSNHDPRHAIAAAQTVPVDRLQRYVAPWIGHRDSK